MTLIDEKEWYQEQEKKRKIFKVIIRLLIILVVICIVLLVYRGITNNKKFKCNLDGNYLADIGDELLLKDDKGKVIVDNGNVYVSIRKLSTILNCQFYNSEYKKKGEDKTKCQVKLDNIYTSYVAGSDKIYKAIVEENSDESKSNKSSTSNSEFEEIENMTKVDFEYFTIANSVLYQNDELYTSLEGIELGFDVSVSYNQKNNTLNIYKLDYLENLAKDKRSNVLSSKNYSYKNKRLLKYGMVILQDENGNLGIGSYTNSDKFDSYVVSCKYTNLDFNEGTKVISAVTQNDNKKCLLYLDLNNQEVTKDITSQYSEIKEITNNFDYFLIKENGKYGIINNTGNIILQPNFEDIGINEEKYSDITSKYILNEKYIPVKINGLWGLYNVNGLKLIEPQYANIGCSLNQSGDSVVMIPNMKNGVTGVVFLYNKEKSFYGVFNADNGEKIAVSLTEVFKNMENNEYEYYINYIIDRSTSRVHTVNVKRDI